MRALRITGVACAVWAWLGVACPGDGPVVSEQGRFLLEEPGLATRTGFLSDLWAGGPVLVGERTCPNLVCLQRDCDERAPEDGGAAACFEQTVTGATFAQGCVEFDAVGDVIWALEPIACQPLPDAGVPLESDRFVFRAVAAADVLAEEQPGLARVARDLLDAGSLVAEPALPAGFGEPRSEVAILEGGQEPVTAALLTIENQSLVAVAGNALALEEMAPAPQSVRVLDGWFLEADPGASATLRLVRATASFDVTTVEGVPLTDVASMSLVALYWSDPDNPGSRAPAAVHALVQDAAGRALDGAPVEWTLVQGEVATNSVYAQLSVMPGDEQGPLRRGPWLMIADLCRPPSWRAGAASALLRARLGALTRDVRLTWTQPPDRDVGNTWFGMPSTSPARDRGFTRDPACPPFPACGCASTRADTRAPPAVAAGLLAALFALLWWAGRRAA